MNSVLSLLKKPSAWFPIAASLAALVMILTAIAIVGLPAEPPKDEGVGAHLFQLWLVLEALMVAFFAVKWLPQRLMQALVVLALQILAVIAACAPVFYFKL